MRALAFNTLGSFADVSRRDELLRFVEYVDPDVAFFADSNWSGDERSPVFARTVSGLGDMGYEVTTGDNQDATPRLDRVGWAGVIRLGNGNGGSIMDTGIRQGYLGSFVDNESGRTLRIGGLHFTDLGEEERLEQVAALPSLDILMGDINAMHREALVARAARLLTPVVRRFPDVSHLREDHDFRLERQPLSRRFRIRLDQIRRVVEMASGNTLKALEATRGLRETAPDHGPTILRLFQLDHILVGPDIDLEEHRVHTQVRLSDHKPVSAVLRPRRLA